MARSGSRWPGWGSVVAARRRSAGEGAAGGATRLRSGLVSAARPGLATRLRRGLAGEPRPGLATRPRKVRGGVGPVPTHPMATTDPAVLRWVVPDGLLPFAGPVERAPRGLQELLDAGVLAGLVVEPGAVLTVLGEGRSWVTEGAVVRSGLVDALGVPESWVPARQARALGPDEVLAAAAEQVIAGQVGRFAAGHGGTIRLVGVHDGVVEVSLGGACEGCAAAAVTLRVRLERLVRRRCPWLVEVRAVDAA